jgi:hypothetical protein
LRNVSRLCLSGLAFLLLAGNAPGSTPEVVTTRVVVRLVHAEGTALGGEGFVVFRGSTSPVVIPAKLPGPVETVLPAGSQWTLVPDFPGYFAANSIVRVPQKPGEGPLRLDVTLWPAGVLTGKFFITGKDQLPTLMEARFEPVRNLAVSRKSVPAGVAACAINGDGDWRCRVPAGNLNTALHAQGFVPHYLWSVAVKPGETVAIEKRKLVRGASVAGWITREDGTPAEKCKVRLEPTEAPGRPNDSALDFLRSVANEVPCQKAGFFQFPAVAAGIYTVVAEDGDAQARMSPVEVWEGSESRISVPITLRRPVDFEVEISPPLDWLGRPWRFEARRAIEHRSGWDDPSFRVEASQEGKVRIPKRLPGRYWFTIYDGLGNSVFSDMHVDLVDPSQPYPIDLDLIWVEGKVQLGKEPLAASLAFGGRSGATSIKLTADETGRFEGPLPKAGSWRVDVVAEEPLIKASANVEVKAKDGRASVTIELPDTRVHGKVVDASGSPAQGASVALRSTVSTMDTQVDEKGEFEFRAFPEGTLELSAFRNSGQAGREESNSYTFEASAESTHGPVALVLRKNRKFRGRVLAPTGPAVGASIDASPVGAGGGFRSTARAQLDGSFEVSVPEGTDVLHVVVSPPGGALKAYEVALASEAEALLQVESLGGELSLDLGKEEADEAFRGRFLVVWQGDLPLPFGTLVHWSEGHGVRFFERGLIRIPQLAPAFYTVCLGAPAVNDPDEIEQWKNRSDCASGYLSAGATLPLRMK